MINKRSPLYIFQYTFLFSILNNLLQPNFMISNNRNKLHIKLNYNVEH